MKCKICNRESKHAHDGNVDIFKCKFCGQYKYAMSYEPDTYSDETDFHKVSSYIKEQNDVFSKTPFIDNEKFDEIIGIKDKKIKEKFDLMMKYLSTLSKYETLDEKILVKCWIKNTDELDILMQKAEDHRFIEGDFTKYMGGYHYPTINNLTFDGLQYIEELEEPNKDSKKIFVAFNFADELKPIFNTQVKEAVEETGFTHKIVNQEITPHDQKITDEIVAQIKSSRMIIADFTGSSTNVYFEAGFAMGMKIPVIWTCKEGHEFSFDTGQFPHITWKDGDDLRQQLINRIKVVI